MLTRRSALATLLLITLSTGALLPALVGLAIPAPVFAQEEGGGQGGGKLLQGATLILLLVSLLMQLFQGGGGGSSPQQGPAEEQPPRPPDIVPQPGRRPPSASGVTGVPGFPQVRFPSAFDFSGLTPSPAPTPSPTPETDSLLAYLPSTPAPQKSPPSAKPTPKVQAILKNRSPKLCAAGRAVAGIPEALKRPRVNPVLEELSRLCGFPFRRPSVTK